MKRLIYVFVFLFSAGMMSNILASTNTVMGDTVFLKLWINCQGIGTMDLREDIVLEGEVYTIKNTVITDPRFVNAQPFIDAVAGSKFVIEDGALNENITIDWFFWNIDCSNGTFITFGGNNLFFNGYYVVNNSPNQYNFANGKVARFTIPKSEKFDSLLIMNGINPDSALVFMFANGMSGDTLGLNSFQTDTTVVFEASHFSQILGGDKALYSILSSEDQESSIPTQFSLRQNYPNPFNPSTTIEYGLPERTFVELKIFNILGKEVATLVNSTQEAGMHNVTFDASKLTSGVYLYKIKTSKFTEFKKMILLK
ncbi:MAG: T9SS type A sorting domain-containing protein [Ignavibacteriales bacterium]|nr:T9SS type A sorting domain-containing protein [Ignavibacteriaceae bacterium]NLH61881.1 T9SS type A sorting domain-containing protein [Ignavibacteriales bacterium]HOJ17916.1 T9SS type A sorting domain-containing protein [Ignavibacteriaceae bacterium]HPO54977.1 T9SS type A sorting domain-containing protein [Ignavibacteriaceae bacterium]